MGEAWKELMLMPHDYGIDALNDQETKDFMQKIQFSHGGPEYDAKYPDGIPSSVEIKLTDGRVLKSGFMMYPPGHARNTTADLKALLEKKHSLLGDLTFKDSAQYEKFYSRLVGMKSPRSATCRPFTSSISHR